MTLRSLPSTLFLFLIIPLLLGCLSNVPISESDSAEADQAAIASSETSDGEATPWIVTPTPEFTPIPPTPTATSTPEIVADAATAVPEPVEESELVSAETPASATETPSPTATPLPAPTRYIDRSCIEPNRAEYKRFWLPNKKWPRPITNPRSHLWLSRPVAEDVNIESFNQDYPYGWDGGRQQALLLHNGLDISRDLGTPVLAAASGTVVVAQQDLEERFGWRCDWYGSLVVIQHDEQWLDQPIFTLYGHVLNINVEVGQRVETGEQLAEVGVGGAAKVRHLHFEVRVGENTFYHTRNPLIWLESVPERTTLIGRLVSPSGFPWQGVPIIAVPRSNDVEQRRSWTYLGDPDGIAVPDEHYAENFVIGDMEPGDYTLFTTVQGVDYNIPISIWPDQVNTIEIVTEPYKTPTPGP